MAGFNPSVLLFAWSVVLVVLIGLPWPHVGVVSMAIFFIAFFAARDILGSLLRRSRWLLLMALVMFGWMTPGMPVSGLPGATADGLQQAAEQISRLLASIAMVSVLLSRLDELSLLGACHGLFGPLRLLGVDVEKLVLRLALTLRKLGKGNDAEEDDSGVVCVPRQAIHLRDFVLLGGVLALALVIGMRLP